MTFNFYQKYFEKWYHKLKEDKETFYAANFCKFICLAEMKKRKINENDNKNIDFLIDEILNNQELSKLIHNFIIKKLKYAN